MADLIPLAELLAEIDREIKRVPACTATLQRARSIAMTIPTVEAEPVVHARWMHDPHDISTFYAGNCSNCGCAPKRRTMSFKPWNYCPNCGARMDTDAPERGERSKKCE